MTRQRFAIILSDVADATDAPFYLRVRLLLKRALRSHKLRVTDYAEVDPGTSDDAIRAVVAGLSRGPNTVQGEL
jgi:hypothetical protein